jgi:hypothetical protein
MLQGNFLVTFALLAFPLLALALTARLRAQVAVPLILLWSQMFLPAQTGIDLPVLPPIDKEHTPGLFALIGCLLFRGGSLKGSRPFRGYDLLIVGMAVAGFITAITNSEPIRYPNLVLQGMSTQDAISDAIKIMISWWPAFYLGRSLYRTSEDFHKLFVTVAVAGVLYTPFLFMELRFSPQLHFWTYGFYQHDFIQTIRASGYRPMVYMTNGLKVAIFMTMTVLAAAGLARAKMKIRRWKARNVMIYLLIALLLCKSAGAILFALLGLLVLFVSNPKAQLRFAKILATAAAIYPCLRIWELLPVDDVIDFFTALVGEDRAGSLAFRLRNEALLTEHALKKLAFGWGGYQRNLIYDPETKGIGGVPDGFWIGMIGGKGLVGYLLSFGLIIIPIWRARAALGKLTDARDKILLGALALMMVFFAVDQIPNETVDPYMLFLVGVLAGLPRGLTPPQPVAEANQPYPTQRLPRVATGAAWPPVEGDG